MSLQPQSDQAPAAPKTSGLAIASLVCSIASFVCLPLGWIPGIVCGHMAQRRLAEEPGLGGAGLARAGLIVGYVAMALNILGALVAATFLLFFTGLATPRLNATAPHDGSPRVTAIHEEPQTTDTAPDGSGWTLDLSDVSIPDTAAAGRLKGRPFKLTGARLDGGWLKLRQGEEFFADLEFGVVLFESDIGKLEGRTFVVPGTQSGPTPHVWLNWKPAPDVSPQSVSFTKDYALRLEFGRVEGGKLPGRIYLCAPDVEKSFVRGTFELQVD